MATRAPAGGPARSRARGPGIPLLAAVLLMRPVLIVLGTFATYGILTAIGRPDAWSYARLLGNVHTVVLADVVTIVVIVWLARREGLRLRELAGIVRGRVLRDVGVGLGVGVLLYAAFVLASVAGVAVAVGVFGPAALPGHVGAMTVAVAEELVYRGWAQPRVQALTGSPVAAVGLVALAFGVQHIAFQLTDPAASLARFVTTALLGVVFGALYLWLRRLLPLIVGHWMVDVVGLGVPMLLASLGAAG